MTELWYENPKVLYNNLNEFIPNKDLTRPQRINAIARFAIYLAVLLVVFKQETKWLSLSVVILFLSWFLGRTENFSEETYVPKEPVECLKPTKENPFMNYTLGDLIDNKERPKACKYDDVKSEMREAFRSHVYSDIGDIWGKYISDRNFYTMPNTDIVNDQMGFALWCYGNNGECKTSGKNCLKQRDPTYHRGRLEVEDNDSFLMR
jgi:hypothetical protein